MNADLVETSRAVMTIIDSLQTYDVSVQVAALAYGFLAYARATGQNVLDVFGTVSNMANGAEGKRAEFRAVDDYVNSLI